ncbi:hypothetical protein [Fluviispira vulneris]|uniref:hypothetical protein n=1 Tax=Fluviispira vulneris TaxID=2763012 RepID=UPI00164403F8|nr:hypothetical protein [Fluviispira vulneris]
MALINFKIKSIDHKNYFYIFEKLYKIEPKLYYWINSFPHKEERYILTQFRHQNFLKYNGLEIAIINKEIMTYHRLPGAKPNGNGNVKCGTHSIQINSMNDIEVSYFCIQKTNNFDITYRPIILTHEKKSIFTHLPCRKLNYHLFIPELSEIIVHGLEVHYQNILLNNNFNYIDKLSKIIDEILISDLDFRIKAISKRIQAILPHFAFIKEIENKGVDNTV